MPWGNKVNLVTFIDKKKRFPVDRIFYDRAKQGPAHKQRNLAFDTFFQLIARKVSGNGKPAGGYQRRCPCRCKRAWRPWVSWSIPGD